MPISSTTTDYSLRTRDISILQAPDPNKVGTQKVSAAFGKVSSFTAGIQKLVQRYTIMLMTIKGSQTNFPDFGTTFLSELMHRSNNMDTLALHHLFNFANLDVISQMKSYQSTLPTTAPLDEQIDTAQLVNVAANGDTVDFQILIKSRAGDTVQYVLPLPNQLTS